MKADPRTSSLTEARPQTLHITRPKMTSTATSNKADRGKATIADHIPLLKNLPGKDDLLVENEYSQSPLLGVDYQENTSLLEAAAHAAGCEVERISPITIIVNDIRGSGGSMMYFRNSNSTTMITHWRLVKDKYQTKMILKQAGISVPEGNLFRSSDYGNALLFATSLFPNVVVKPSNGSGGKGITVGVSDEYDFERAWVAAGLQSDGYILVEEYFQGQCEARFLVVDNKCISVTGRIPPYLTGDGNSTIQQLVDQKNRVRRSNPNLASKLLVLDEARIRKLDNRGYTPETVLTKDETIIIDWKAGLSSGADSIQLIEHVHPSYLNLAETVCREIPGLTVCGVDIMAHDFSKPLDKNNHIIVELNSGPGLGGHHFPVFGASKDVAGAIVECHLNFLRKHSDDNAGTLLADNLRNDFKTGDNVLIKSMEKDLEHRNPIEERGPNRLVEIYLFGNLYDSGILSFISNFCEDNDIHGWVRNRIDYVSSCSVRARIMGTPDAVDGLITELRDGRFSERITNVMVVKSRKRVNSGFRILKDSKIAIKEKSFVSYPRNTFAASDPQKDESIKISIRGDLRRVDFKTWCIGKALSIGLNINCKWKSGNDLRCNLEGPYVKIQEFLQSVIIGPEGARVKNVRIIEKIEQPPLRAFIRRILKGVQRRLKGI